MLAGSSPAHANVEIGGIAGAHVFSDKSELGTTDGPNAPSQRNSILLGVRIGAYLGDLFGIEAEVAVIPTVARRSEFSVTDLAYRAQLVLQLRAHDPAHRVIPFVVAGAGAFTVVQANDMAFRADPTRDIGPDTAVGFYAGLGMKVRIGSRAGLRLDGRAIIVPSSENTTPVDPNSTKVTLDLEAMASAYVDLGREPVKRIAPPPPPEDPDPDGDGVRGAADRCPGEAEDKDGYQDDDGCPDPDNDADGIADTADRCPLEAEDKDGFQDDDGCPDPDNDADGIPDAADRCPLEPEDRDGFEDGDGCPDPDNDGDGVLDAADACLDQLETKNGYKDDDGCPDELPPAVLLVNGVLPRVTFKANAETLTSESKKTLDQVVAVLVEYGDLEVTIGVHTDDAVLARGLYADNLELSAARAEAVKVYLVAKGVDPARLVAKGFGETMPRVPPTGLTGAKLGAARASNRRVELHLISRLK